MAKISLITYPQKVLKRRASVVAPTPEIKNLIVRMIETMYENGGIGLAAPQIGISKQIIIVETSDNPREHKHEHHEGTSGKPLAFLNPRLTKKSKETHVEEEGCLSLPDVFVEVKRPKNIQVVCQTPEGKEVNIEANGLVARIFQHEIDHLNGKLIMDHLNPIKRFRLHSQLKKLRKQNK